MGTQVNTRKGRPVGELLQDPDGGAGVAGERGAWRDADDVVEEARREDALRAVMSLPRSGRRPTLSEMRARNREVREARYRAGLPDEAGAFVMAAYIPGAGAGREFTIDGRSASTTDVAAALLERRLAYADSPEALAPAVNNYLVGHGYRVRAYPRHLGIGNNSPNRDPRAQAQRRIS